MTSDAPAGALTGSLVDLATGQAARAHRATERLHALVYFGPEATEQFTAIGLRPGSMPYFASRSAPMGAVGPGVVAATFYNFNPAMIARHIPRAWTLASVQAILAARLRVADLTMRRLLGTALDDPEIAELADLARAATGGLSPEGRPLFAGHASLPWPDEPHLVLWHAVSLLREYRGDGHTAALLEAGLSGLEALVTHTVTGFTFNEASAKLTRGWSDEEWHGAVEALRSRGLLSHEGRLSADGEALRERVEAATDRLAAAPWRNLGEQRTERLIELGRRYSRIVVAGDAFPATLFNAPPGSGPER
jgi:hypothetical protein